MVIPFDAKQKEMHWLDTLSTMWPWPLTSPVAFTFYISNCCLMWTESKQINWIVDYVTLPYDQTHTHTIWPCPWIFKVKVWNSLISLMEGLIDMEWKGCESFIHDHDSDLLVNIVGWVDVPDSDWVT